MVLVMGVFDALVYPTPLSIITSAYPGRAERTRAIGVWGAVAGLGVAAGPVTGGLLLAHFWYGSVFWAAAGGRRPASPDSPARPCSERRS
jgi:MFS family permease